MGADNSFWLHRGLFWEIASAVILGGRGIAASGRFAREQKVRSISHSRSSARYGILIYPGVFAPKLPYYLYEETLHNKLGVDVFIADMGFINAHSHFQMMRLARESFLHTLEVENLNQLVLVGHSIGGLVALMLLGYYPDRIKKVFCVTSSVNTRARTPWKALAWVISTFVARPGVQKRVLKNIIQNAAPYAEKVVTISTMSDVILPNSATRFLFPGAKNYVYDARRDARFSRQFGEEALAYARRRLENYRNILNDRRLWATRDTERFWRDVEKFYNKTWSLFDMTILNTHAGFHVHPFALDVIFRTLQEES